MAYAFVQQNANDNAATATTITVTLTPTAGNLLVFCVSGDALDTTSIALSDNLGAHNTFTQISTDLVSVADQRCAWWFAANCQGGATTFTATFSATTRFRTIYVAEYSGIATSSPFLNGARAEQNGPGTGTDAVSSGNANATSQPALAWGFSINVNGNSAPNAGTGYTARATVWSSATCTGRPEDKRVTATGNVAATWTATTGTDPHSNAIGLFAEAASTPTVSSWEPSFPDRSSARPSVSALGVAVAPVLAIALAPLCWAPSFPDRVPARPVPNLATGVAVEPVFVPPTAPPLSWSPDFPDLAPRPRAAQLASGMVAPVAPNPVPSLASWTAGYTDSLPRARAQPVPSGATAPVLPLPNAAASIFPLTVSSNGRHLRKNDGTPFLVCADSTWSIFVDIPLSGVASYFSTLASQGFNAILGNAIEHHYTVVKPPAERGGEMPFTQRMDGATYTGSPNGTSGAAGTQGQFASDNYGSPASQSPDPTFINNAYWQAVEQILDAAQAANLLVFLWPAYLGFHAGDEGWMGEMVTWDAVIGAGGFTGQSFADPTKSKAWNYGAWMAARWKNYKHIVWTMGGDYGTNTQTLSAPQRAAVVSLVAGLKSVAGQQSLLWTAHWDRPCISDDNPIAGVTFDINFGYCDEAVAELVRRGYSTAVKPSVLGEYNYEDGLFGGSAPWRKYTWWGFLGGCAGGFYGHEQLWRFDDGTPGTDYTTLLATQARFDVVRQFAFLKARPWHRLVPNGLGGIGTLVTSGGGTASPQSTDYVAAAATLERDLLLAYVPPAHTGSVTVDMTKLGASVTARWFDPANATFTAIGTFANTGTHAFTTPGNNSAGDADWLLVLEAPDAPLPLSWGPIFPDRAPRLSLPTSVVVSGVVEPVVPPPPATIGGWGPDFPDATPRARQPVNVGGSSAPVLVLPDAPALSWGPDFPDRIARPAVQLLGGPVAPPSDANAGPLTWAPGFPDRASGPARAPAGGATAPPTDTNAGPLTWSPLFPDRTPARPRATESAIAAPIGDVTAALLSWQPHGTPPAPRPRQAIAGGETAPILVQVVVPVLAWAPQYPDAVSRARAAQIVGGSAAPESTLPNAPAPILSWAPSYPDRLLRGRAAQIVGGSAAPELSLPNPPLSWAPAFPDFTPRPRALGILGGAIQPEAVLPNAPAPALSWSPSFPDRAPRALAAVIVGGMAHPEALIPTVFTPLPKRIRIVSNQIAAVFLEPTLITEPDRAQFRQGQTHRPLIVTAFTESALVDFPGEFPGGVTFRMVSGSHVVTGPATGDSQGRLTYAWQVGDLDVIGTYQAYFIASDGAARTETIPDVTNLEITVIATI